jgi:hypothetical protein
VPGTFKNGLGLALDNDDGYTEPADRIADRCAIRWRRHGNAQRRRRNSGSRVEDLPLMIKTIQLRA